MTCSHTNQDFHRFCTTCGEKLDRVMCHQCSAVNLVSAQFCYMCGCEIQVNTVSVRADGSQTKMRLKEIVDVALGDVDETLGDAANVSQKDIELLFEKTKK